MVTKSVRVEQLSGVELDYIVAFLEGAKNFDNSSGVMCFDLKGKKFFLSSNSEQKDRYSPSSDVSIGGEILFREMSQACGKMLVKNEKRVTDKFDFFSAEYQGHNWESSKKAYGETPLIAAMRCFTLNKLGGTIAFVPLDLI